MPAISLDEHFATAAPPRRADLERLHGMIREAAPELEVEVTPTMLGYGPYHYRYASGREGDSHLLSIANRKQYISLYVNCASEGRYLAESFAGRLPKADVGRSCIRFKRLADVDAEVLRELVRTAARQGPPAAADAAT